MGMISAAFMIAWSQAMTSGPVVAAPLAQDAEVASVVLTNATAAVFVPLAEVLIGQIASQSQLSEKEQAELQRQMNEMRKEIEAELKKIKIEMRRAPRGAFMIHGGFDPHVGASDPGSQRAKNQAMRRVVTRF